MLLIRAEKFSWDKMGARFFSPASRAGLIFFIIESDLLAFALKMTSMTCKTF